MNKESKIYVAGHNGMVGSAIIKALIKENYKNLLLADFKQLDLRIQKDVEDFFETNKPDVVILAAAKVGGINANINDPTAFLYDNLMIQNNVIINSHKIGVEKFVFLGSSCIYPRESQQPIREEYLLTGPLEPTNEGYALSKITGIKLVQYLNKQYGFPGINIIPCNLYGPNDSFDIAHSHVLSALVKKLCDAQVANIKEIQLWGSGKPKREFMHVDDLANAVLYFMEGFNESSILNIGWGEDISIIDLASLICKKLNFEVKIIWDKTKVDGMMLKCMDVTRMKSLGYFPTIKLEHGVEQMISIYRNLKK